jgi:hypothetical protein
VAVAAIKGQPIGWLLHGAFENGPPPNGYGYGLGIVYLMWLIALVILYFPCKWYADLKQRQKDWWLSYV